jgi:hypothetical protein
LWFMHKVGYLATGADLSHKLFLSEEVVNALFVKSSFLPRALLLAVVGRLVDGFVL